jgi:catechol-2,3-dioxygenase
MPTRTDLARWILHAAKARVPFTGASDHDVSEAIYLDDPEGNGVEVYSDRPREKWRRDRELVFQKTDPLTLSFTCSSMKLSHLISLSVLSNRLMVAGETEPPDVN